MTHSSPEAHRAHRRNRVDTKYTSGHSPASPESGADRAGKLVSRDALEGGNAKHKPGRTSSFVKPAQRLSGRSGRPGSSRTGSSPVVHSK